MILPKQLLKSNAPELTVDWELRFSANNGPLQSLTADAFTETAREEFDGTLTVTWHGDHPLGRGFTVAAEFRRNSDGVIACRLCWSPTAPGVRLEEVVFPRFILPYPEGSEFLTGFCDLGWRRPGGMRMAPGDQERPSCDAMQFSGLIVPGGDSFYLEHRDPDFYTKELEVICSDDGKQLRMGAIYFPGLDDAEHTVENRIPYESCFCFFTGDWFDAAAIYRRWALRQKWHTERTEPNPLRDIDLWIWNRGVSDEVLPPIERLASVIGGDVKLALDWYWWHHNPYDTDYPDFWPPREGEMKFRNAVRRLRELGVFTQTYVNGLCWDMDGASWSEGGEEGVIRLRDGEPKAVAYNRYNHHRLAYMCGESPRFSERLRDVIDRLRDAGLDGQYLDMIGGSRNSRCWNPAHRHPKNGGCYNVTGYRALLRGLGDRTFPLTLECANEAFMKETAGAMVCGTLSAEHIGFPAETLPLFPAVYHGRYALFGGYASIDGIPPWDPLWPAEDRMQHEKPWHLLYPDQFFLELARAVVWGIQPMVCNLRNSLWEDESFAPSLRFLCDTAHFWHDYREFLFDGEMLAPGKLVCDRKMVTFAVRTIFTKEGECREIKRDLPTVLHSRWRSPAGNEALVLVNYTAEPRFWNFGSDGGILPPRSYAIRREAAGKAAEPHSI